VAPGDVGVVIGNHGQSRLMRVWANDTTQQPGPLSDL